ncbi:hypothetical protein SAMN02983003_0691 [Devosia enhydra]|uniref:Uncharacterized protein n=1 Tax=Devosia enhydra TaxID=665118 RepID=A0A1K2HUB2_9HYPH|nr:hypothetical protein [Devosia enhydra]SFZ81786.1 hypothetical protein SAMN02983003_0691 [Devosia enhydra]
MSILNFASTKSAAAIAASIPGDRSAAIAEALASTVPAGLTSKSAALSELRARHTELWDAHRAAIAAHIAESTPATRNAVTDTKAAMDELAEPIAKARAEVRREREKFEPTFHRQVKTLYRPLVDRLQVARDVLGEVQAELAAIDAAANQLGMSVPNRAGGMPSLPLLDALIEGLADDAQTSA